MNKFQQRVAIYTRVSSQFQIEGDSLPMQRNDLKAYSELILGISDYEIFEDAGYSGKNTNRPAFQNMMDRIEKREFSHVLVWKIDRVSRNLIDFSSMYESLKKNRVVFVSKQEQFDTSTAMGEAVLKIILVFAELERKMTSERVTATMISRANQGLWNGGRIPYGYSYDKDSKEITICEEEAEVCRLIADDYMKNKSMLHAAKLLNELGYTSRAGVEWSQSTIRSIVQNPFYVGDYRYNRLHGNENRTVNNEDEWIVFENHHPAIFTYEQHYKMLEISKENKTVQNTADQHNRHKHVHVFNQICYCGKCGQKMLTTVGRIHKDGYQTSIHVCRARKNNNFCDNPAVNDLVIGEFVVNLISNIITAKKTFSGIGSPQKLQDYLLNGQCFSNVSSMGEPGINALYDLLSHYKSDNSFTLVSKPQAKAPDTEFYALKKERKRHERAMKRLNDLYLYSDDAMSEKDYLLNKQEIVDKITEIDRKMGLKMVDDESAISDSEFIKKASHLLINARLKTKKYIYYKNLSISTSTDVLREYIHSIVDNIYIADKHITSITFKNAITLSFSYK